MDSEERERNANEMAEREEDHPDLLHQKDEGNGEAAEEELRRASSFIMSTFSQDAPNVVSFLLRMFV